MVERSTESSCPSSFFGLAAALVVWLQLSCNPAHAEDRPQGDLLHVQFTLPFKEALAKAQKEKKLLFLKPIYGGVDKAGASDHRCGTW